MTLKARLDRMSKKELTELANNYITGKFSNMFFSGLAFGDYFASRVGKDGKIVVTKNKTK